MAVEGKREKEEGDETGSVRPLGENGRMRIIAQPVVFRLILAPTPRNDIQEPSNCQPMVSLDAFPASTLATCSRCVFSPSGIDGAIERISALPQRETPPGLRVNLSSARRLLLFALPLKLQNISRKKYDLHRSIVGETYTDRRDNEIHNNMTDN